LPLGCEPQAKKNFFLVQAGTIDYGADGKDA
jgi:hypothetical protein